MLLAALGVVVAAIVAQLTGYVHVNAIWEGGRLIGSPPPLATQRQEIIRKALAEGLVLKAQRVGQLAAGGGQDWFVLFDNTRHGSDEMRLYETEDGELRSRMTYRPLITIHPGGKPRAVDAFVEPIRDYDGDGFPDVVGGFQARLADGSDGVRPFFLRYAPKVQTFTPFPLLAKRLDIVYRRPIHLPDGETVPKGRVFPYERPALIALPGRDGFLYEGMWSFAVGYSKRLKGAVVVTALSPKTLDHGFRWKVFAWGIGLFNGSLRRSACLFDQLDLNAIVLPSVFLSDVESELHRRIPHVGNCW